MASVYGCDILLQDGDLIATPRGEIYTADDYEAARGDASRFPGYYNIVFAMANALFTPIGEIPYDTAYGTKLPFAVGSPGNPSTKQVIQQAVRDAAALDPRIKSVDAVSVDIGTDNTATVKASLVVAGKTSASEFVFPNFVVE